MPTHLKAQVVLQYNTLLSEDRAVNTFHFSSTSDPVAGAIVAAQRLSDFYSTQAPGQMNMLSYYLSGMIHPTLGSIRVYNMDEIQPRPPIYETLLPLTIWDTFDELPAEVACCSSFSADASPGVPIARRRGRIYVGPLNSNTLSESAQVSRPAYQFRFDLARATRGLAQENTPDLIWSVYSQTGNALAEVVRGHVDDAWDTQRRRGVRRTSRLTWDA